MKIFALASLLLLQGQTVFADECCPASEAVGWKCGNHIYRCTSNSNVEPPEPVASCDEGVGQAKEILLDPTVCAAMQAEAIEIGEDCFHYLEGYEHEGFKQIRELSNRICVSGSGEITKYDGGSCHTCGTTDPATVEVLSAETNADEVFVPDPAVVEAAAVESAAVEAESGGCCGEGSEVVGWKCGQYVYRCQAEDSGDAIATCEQGVGKATEILVGAEQCEAMQHITIGAGCEVPGYHTHALSNRICVDSQGMISKDDGSCSPCGQVEDYVPPTKVEEPVPNEPVPETEAPVPETEAPVPETKAPAPEEPETRPPVPEEPVETPIQATDPPLTRAPIVDPEPEEACPDDVVLLETDGTANYPNGAVKIISQDTETVTVEVTSALSSNNVNNLYYQYYETAFSEHCYSRTTVLASEEIPPSDSFELTIECTHSGNFALLEFWVVDDKLDTETNTAVIPQCCQATEEEQALGVTKYLVEIRCITSCPDSTA